MRDTLAELADRYGDDDEERAAMLAAAQRELARRIRQGGKRCSRCGELLPLSYFGANRARPDGLAAYCRACRAEHAL